MMILASRKAKRQQNTAKNRAPPGLLFFVYFSVFGDRWNSCVASLPNTASEYSSGIQQTRDQETSLKGQEESALGSAAGRRKKSAKFDALKERQNWRSFRKGVKAV